MENTTNNNNLGFYGVKFLEPQPKIKDLKINHLSKNIKGIYSLLDTEEFKSKSLETKYKFLSQVSNKFNELLNAAMIEYDTTAYQFQQEIKELESQPTSVPFTAEEISQISGWEQRLLLEKTKNPTHFSSYLERELTNPMASTAYLNLVSSGKINDNDYFKISYATENAVTPKEKALLAEKENKIQAKREEYRATCNIGYRASCEQMTNDYITKVWQIEGQLQRDEMEAKRIKREEQYKINKALKYYQDIESK